MGRETSAQCQWGSEAGFCKVLLETKELILRGGLRRRIPRSSLREVSVHNELLRFCVGEDEVSLQLGSELAQQWAKALLTPPPTLAMKMGISRTTRLLLLGRIGSEELKTAIAEGCRWEDEPDDQNVDLIVAQVKSTQDLDLALDQLPSQPFTHPAIWIVYPKKAAGVIGETAVREALRRRRFIDTRIASVSAELTALRFIQRRS